MRAEQVAVIYRQAPPALAISLIVALLVAYLLWEVTPGERLFYWVALIASLSLARLGLVFAFRKRAAASNIAHWERRFVVSLVATGLAWGVGGIVVMPQDSLAHQAMVYFFLMGMAGGAVASYSAHAACTSATIVSVMMPATLWFLAQDSMPLRVMALGGLVYVAAAWRATNMLGFFVKRSFDLAQQLADANEAAQLLARTDELTGLANRRAFREAGEQAVEASSRYRRPLAMVMLDIDHFKQINDSHGHGAGDAALRLLADALRDTKRAPDVVGRLGGEEFAVLLPETTAEDAAVQAERVRAAVAKIRVPEGAGFGFSCSFGVAQLHGSGDSLDKLLKRADKALYRAKAEGRDRVVLEHNALAEPRA